MIGKYCVGTVQLPQDTVDWESTALACNLAIASGTQVMFKRSIIEGEKTILPFAGKLSAEAAVKEVFEGCPIRCKQLNVNYFDKKAMRIARRVNAVNSKTQSIEPADIKPCSEYCHLEEGIVGREAQVELIRSIAKVVNAFGRDAAGSMHMLFTGPPGVGNSMFAQAMLGMLDGTGAMLDEGVFVNASATDLVSPYVGETPHLVKSAFDKADGGILFIDEAYRLSRQSPSVSGSDHGQEAIDAINQLMEERRDSIIVIFAGYPDEMNDFLKHNPGLRGRIGYELEFGEYEHDELLEIFCKMARNRGFDVDGDAVEFLEAKIPALTKLASFANARTMRKLLDHSVIGKAEGKLDRLLSVDDVKRALGDKEFQATDEDKGKILGFAG